MNYFVTRDGQEYGPYSLADLQRYVASGQILATDLARSEGMPESLPVSQIIGTIPVPVAAPIPVAGPPMPDYPDPPNLHWGLVLLFGILTCGVFSIVWDLILAIVDEESSSTESRSFLLHCRGCASGVCLLFELRNRLHPHSSRRLYAATESR